jgi:hypothetical protein
MRLISQDKLIAYCDKHRTGSVPIEVIKAEAPIFAESAKWISCKDKMPEDNTSVLFVYVSENGIKSVHYGYHQTLKGLGSSWAKPSGGWQYCDDDVTHWQPLPEPPKE